MVTGASARAADSLMYIAYRTSAATTRAANYALGLHCARRIGFTLERDVRIIANHIIFTAIFRVQ